MAIEKHETKECPRCGAAFVCMANRVHRCACARVRLSPEAAELIRSRFDDCLCTGCLQLLDRAWIGQSTGPVDAKRGDNAGRLHELRDCPDGSGQSPRLAGRRP